MQQPDRADETKSTDAGQSPGTTPPSAIPDRQARIRSFRPILIFDIVGPLVAYSVLRSHGASQVLALILAGILPAIGVLIDVIHNRSLDVVGCVVLGGLLLGAILGLPTHSPRAVLLEGSVVTGAFALAALGSLFTKRPLMFHLAQAALGGAHSLGAGTSTSATTPTPAHAATSASSPSSGDWRSCSKPPKSRCHRDVVHRLRPHLHPGRALSAHRHPPYLDDGLGPSDPATDRSPTT